MKNESIQTQDGEHLGLFMLTCKCAVGLAGFSLALAGCLFIPAGTMNWAMAWVYIGVFAFGGIICTPILLRVNPDVVTERLRLRKRAGKKRDVLLASMMGAFWVCGFLTAGVDHRFCWSALVAPPLQLAGVAIMAAGYLFGVWAMAVNRFFAWFVRIQEDRGHRAVTTGPYRFVRHPGYLGGIAMMIATPIILGSLWAFIPMGLSMCLLVARTAVEDRTLQAELDGYGAFARRVRYRLLPRVW